MPAFTFEKISPPARRAPAAESVATTAVVRKERNVIVQMLDRFVEVRVKRTLRKGKGVIAEREPKPRD